MTRVIQSTLFIVCWVLFIHTSLLAQEDGSYDVRFHIHEIDCVNSKIYVDIEVRAEDPTREFYIADMNYRLSFNRAAITNPQIHQELALSGFVPPDAPTSIYSDHTLTGSIDTLISYNVELAGGTGAFIDHITYVEVGRLSFDIVSFDEQMELFFHTKDPYDFPPTIINGKDLQGVLYGAEEGSFVNYFQDLSVACVNEPPIVVNDMESLDKNTPKVINLVTNDLDPFLDLSSLALLTTPPSNEGTVVVNTTTGEITFTPATDFVGTVTPFQYQICDQGFLFPSTKGNQNSNPVTLPDPADPPLIVGTPECSTGMIFLEVLDNVDLVRVSAKVFLGGCYNSNSGLMNDVLRSFSYIPLIEPYTAMGLTTNGGEQTTNAVLLSTGNDAVVDWIFIELRDKINPINVLHTRSALLQRDGDIVDVDGVSPVDFLGVMADDYYVAIRHRNHLAIMSNTTFSLSSMSTMIDFSTSPSATYGTNAQINFGNGVLGLWHGDASANNSIEASDRSLTWNSRNQSGYLLSDLNMDGSCTASDRSIAWNNRNKTAQLP